MTALTAPPVAATTAGPRRGVGGTGGEPVSVVVRGVTVVAVVTVAVIAAVVSYSHMQQLAASAGEAWRSWLIPLSIDGLVVAASMVLVTRRHHGVGGGHLAWGALGVGVAASLAANMADARPEITAVLVAGWPAVAFAVALELLLQQRRADQHTTTTDTDVSTQLPAVVAPDPPPHRLPPVPLSAPPPADPASAVDLPSVVGVAAPAVDPVEARVRELMGRRGRVPGRRVVARELGISEYQARTVLERITAPSVTRAALNTTGGQRR
jgi:hypothetical protein